MPTPQDQDTSFITKPHYVIKNRPDFLDDSFALKLSAQSQKLFELGKPGQGYVGLVDLDTGEIHLLPAFNKGDGLQRLDKFNAPFEQQVESIAKLGKLAGDLHLKASKLCGLENKSSRVLGFGLWKSGFSVKFLPAPPKPSSCVPYEFVLIKDNNSFQLIFINEKREAQPWKMPAALAEFLETCASKTDPGNEIRESDQSQIESILRKEIGPESFKATFNFMDTAEKIKYVKNRSTSQNALAIQYTKEYRRWFLARNKGHTSHADDLIRELPQEVFNKILETITQALHSSPIALDGPIIPKGVDGIFAHFLLEKFWMTHKEQALLEYGIVSTQASMANMALISGAYFSKYISKFSENDIADFGNIIIDFSLENNLKNIVTFFLHYAQNSVFYSSDLIYVLKKKIALFPEHEEFLSHAIEKLNANKKANEALHNAIFELINLSRYNISSDIIDSKISCIMKLLDSLKTVNFCGNLKIYEKQFRPNLLALFQLGYFSLVDAVLNKKIPPETLQEIIVKFSPETLPFIKRIFTQIKSIYLVDKNSYTSEYFNLGPKVAKGPGPGLNHNLVLTKEEFCLFLNNLLICRDLELFSELIHFAPASLQKELYLQLEKNFNLLERLLNQAIFSLQSSSIPGVKELLESVRATFHNTSHHDSLLILLTINLLGMTKACVSGQGIFIELDDNAAIEDLSLIDIDLNSYKEFIEQCAQIEEIPPQWTVLMKDIVENLKQQNSQSALVAGGFFPSSSGPSEQGPTAEPPSSSNKN